MDDRRNGTRKRCIRRMLEPTYIEWIFAGLAIILYLFIWIKGYMKITDNENKKKGRKKDDTRRNRKTHY